MIPANVRAQTPPWHPFTAANGLAGNIVQAIWEEPGGALWFGTENGASRYDGHHWTTYRTAEGLLDTNVWSVSGTGDAVWFATSSGLSVLEHGQWRSYTIRDGLPNNDVRAVLVDREGGVWVGTFGGGVAHRRPNQTTWEPVPLAGEQNVIVQAIWQAPDDTIWFGTNGVGAFQLRKGKIEQFGFRDVGRNIIWAVGGDATVTWLGTFHGVIEVRTNNAIKVVDHLAQATPISDTEILAVAAGSADSVWFGTRAHGILHLDHGRWERFTTEQGLSRNYVQSILADRAGRVWFGTRGAGVMVLDPTTTGPAQLDLKLTARNIQDNSILALNQTPLRFDQNNLQFVFGAAVSWLPPQAISFRYWLATPTEPAPAARIARSSAGAQVQAESEAFVNLAPGRYTLHVVPEIDGVSGTESLYPFTIQSAPPGFAPGALQTSVNGQTITSGLRLPDTMFDRVRSVEIGLAATDDATPADRLHYRFQLDDAAWQSATGTGVLLHLPPGTHQVALEAIDGDGNHSPAAHLTVVVPKPFWITLVTALAAVLVPSVLSGGVGAWGYRRWAERQALVRAVRGHLIPYDVGPLITAPERYIGRQHMLNTILGQIDNNSFYVYGEKRIGKTSLAIQLKHLLEVRNGLPAARRYLPVFHNMQDLPQYLFWHALMRTVADKVDLPLLVAQRSPADYDDLDAQDDLDALMAHMRAADPEREPLLVVLLDEVDTFQRYDPVIRQRFRAFCQAAQGLIQVVLIGVAPPQAEPGETSPWSNIFVPLPLEPLDATAIRFLIRNYNQNPYGYTAEAEAALEAAGDRKPYDTQWLCAEAVKAMLTAGRTTVVLADVEQAIQTVVGERRRDYAALWTKLDASLCAAIERAHHQAGLLPPEGLAIGEYDPLFQAGVALKTPTGARLATLFSTWLATL